MTFIYLCLTLFQIGMFHIRNALFTQFVFCHHIYCTEHTWFDAQWDKSVFPMRFSLFLPFLFCCIMLKHRPKNKVNCLSIAIEKKKTDADQIKNDGNFRVCFNYGATFIMSDSSLHLCILINYSVLSAPSYERLIEFPWNFSFSTFCFFFPFIVPLDNVIEFSSCR